MARSTPVRLASHKVLDRCPHCGSRRPKELVEGTPKLNWHSYLAAGLCTCGLSLPLVDLFRERQTLAWCQSCNRSFLPG